MICGLILAGGRSRRFGREKAMVELDGQALVDRVAAVFSPAGALAVSARPGSAVAAHAILRGWPVVHDARPIDAGPLAGVLAGLIWAEGAGASWLCTAPCDTPFLPKDMIARLVEKAGAGGAAARTAEGIQPLCALWPVDALQHLSLWRRGGSARRALSALAAVEVGFEDAAAFANLNTPEDFAAAETAAASGLR